LYVIFSHTYEVQSNPFWQQRQNSTSHARLVPLHEANTNGDEISLGRIYIAAGAANDDDDDDDDKLFYFEKL
jgi:hypothetical protein